MCVRVRVSLQLCASVPVSRVFEVTDRPGGGENLQDETVVGENQEGLGRFQETGVCVCFQEQPHC